MLRIGLCLICAIIISGTASSVLAQSTPSEKNVTALPKIFYKHFVGTIDGQPAKAVIRTIEGGIFGWYKYKSSDRSVPLSLLEKKSKDGHLVFAETLIVDDTTASYSIWKCTFMDGKLSGTRYSADKTKTKPIRLKEHYPEGITQFGYQTVEKKINTLGGTEIPPVSITRSYPTAIGDDPDAAWLNNEIKKLLNSTQKRAFLIRALRNGRGGKRISVTSNAANYVQLELALYDTLDLVNGIYDKIYKGYDLLNHKILELSDITTIDSLGLQHLLEAQFRKQHGLGPQEPLNTILLTNHLPSIDSFVFKKNGISFIYDPYNYSSYASRSFFIFVPYEKLKGTLVPRFKKRMHLE